MNEQIDLLESAKEEIKSRERFRIKDASSQEHLFLSPGAGEEYLVGILYSQLAAMLPKKTGYEKYWRKVITFSTQGIDSLGLVEVIFALEEAFDIKVPFHAQHGAVGLDTSSLASITAGVQALVAARRAA